MSQQVTETTPACGFLLMDKPTGLTSFKLLGPVKKTFKPAKVGHAGTLDQEARGLMIVAVGKASRLLQFPEVAHKTYEFTLHVGRQTASAEFYHPEVIQEDLQERFTPSQLMSVIPQFKGKIQQTPPQYSAVKIDGKRASDRVRAGEEVELKSREVEIFSLEILDSAIESNHLVSSIRMRCHCSKGTYIRSLGVDLAQEMGLMGSVSDIYRTQIGEWHVSQAVSLGDYRELIGLAREPGPELKLDQSQILQDTQGSKSSKKKARPPVIPIEASRIAEAEKLLIPPHQFLKDWPQVKIKSKTAHYLRQGMRQRLPDLEEYEAQQVFVISGEDNLVCIALVSQGELCPKVVM